MEKNEVVKKTENLNSLSNYYIDAIYPQSINSEILMS